MSKFSDRSKWLEERRNAGLYRQRRIVNSAQSREMFIDGHKLLNFCSNDYLGLANDKRVIKAFQQAAEIWGVGSGASHLVSGHTKAHEELEEALAEFTGRPRCLLFSSGYAANMGAIQGLLSSADHIFEDRLNHASLLDGGRISRARLKRYMHRDAHDLDNKLSKVSDSKARKLVVTDGTFSMDGTVCDVDAIAEITHKHNAWMMLDEAHSLGVIGKQGCGLADPDNYSVNDVQILIGTLGKALGTQGGFVTGSEELIETLIQQARTYIYSTAIPSAIAVATLTSLQIAREEEWRRERLRELVQKFRIGATQLGLKLLDSKAPIQPIILGDAHTAVKLSNALEDLGILITAIRPPTVPANTSRLRITFTAEHTDDDLKQLLSALEQTAA
ncbi:MAG: 8-amino-7-oxononanoate synthase [Gammaproteobacteria bacterium]|nr:8-amino-7-oxononanoate synthase [Gammaproteobacteria bacterium]MCP4089506.1 8-amino-7-oxononanoate synthase [Gammaproteobacteria bacterium]MCP4276212.1 8-amino-7-oxononanoate synthase [Gammaproteobacteria bacterium]MCP4832909.1 8-amino-7-oxononanoate synthase [Gammaproteobacteria bacterium]MCP4930034.1 8-amino-7-oxononanoate synthase [Gammaproteobacteria bacterium]